MIHLNSVRSGCLNIPSLDIPPGIIAITGPNGSGKTTLLELIAGIQTPDAGSVLISGREPRQCTIGWVCEFPDMNMTFTRVSDEIASSLRFSGGLCQDIDKSVADIAGQLGISHLLTRSVRELSGGEKVLVALGAALVSSPELLILDETDSHLDYYTLITIDRIIRSRTVPCLLYASHRPDRIALADRVIVVLSGMVSHEGTPDEVFDRSGADDVMYLDQPALWRSVYAVDS